MERFFFLLIWLLAEIGMVLCLFQRVTGYVRGYSKLNEVGIAKDSA